MHQVVELREIQNLALEILKVVKFLCEEQDITYHLVYVLMKMQHQKK